MVYNIISGWMNGHIPFVCLRKKKLIRREIKS